MSLLWMLACGPVQLGPAHTGLSGTGEDFALELEAAPELAHVAVLSWSGGPTGEAHLEWVDPEGQRWAAPAEEVEEDGVLRLTGLLAAEPYRIELVIEAGGQELLRSEALDFQVEPPPDSLPSLELVQLDEEALEADGAILASLSDTEGCSIIVVDRQGRLRWHFRPEQASNILSTHLSLDGASVWAIASEAAFSDEAATLYQIALDGSFLRSQPVPNGHHDLRELADGRVMWIGSETRTVQMAGEERPTTGDTLWLAAIEWSGERAEKNPGQQVASLFDLESPGVACSHVTQELRATGGLDWTHANSVLELPGSGLLLMNARNLDTLYAFDAESGALAWRMGGQRSDFSDLSGDALWDHAHISDVWEGGMLIFDNGNHRSPNSSRITELAIDLEARTVEKVWDSGSGALGFVNVVGDARRLPGGNVLVSTGGLGGLMELDRAGMLLWKLESPDRPLMGRLSWLPSFLPEQRSSPL